MKCYRTYCKEEAPDGSLYCCSACQPDEVERSDADLLSAIVGMADEVVRLRESIGLLSAYQPTEIRVLNRELASAKDQLIDSLRREADLRSKVARLTERNRLLEAVLAEAEFDCNNFYMAGTTKLRELIAACDRPPAAVCQIVPIPGLEGQGLYECVVPRQPTAAVCERCGDLGVIAATVGSTVPFRFPCPECQAPTSDGEEAI